MLIIGVIGALLLLVAWVFETEESIRRHKKLLDLKFAFIYIIGISLLAVYAFQINDPIFFWLEVAIIIVVLFEIFYTLHFKLEKTNRRIKDASIA